MWLGNFLILMIVGRLVGDATLGAHMIALRIESVSFLGGLALGMDSATLTGQYLGMGEGKGARSAAVISTWFAAAYMGIWGIAYLAVPTQMVRLVTKAEPLISKAPEILRIYGHKQNNMAIKIM